jgi:hypothetical protein
VEDHESSTPGSSPESDLPAKVPRRWVGPAAAPAPEPQQKREYKPDKAWDKLLLVIGAAALVAALLIVPGILNQGGQNPVAEAAQATMDSSGVRMTFSANIDGPFRMTMRGNGVLNGETRRAAIGLNTSITGAETRNFRMQEIVDDDTVYVRSHDAGGLGLGSGWVRIERGGDDSGGSLLGGTSSTSPKQLLDCLESASTDVSTVGNEALGGRDTTHYTAHIDMQKFIDQVRDHEGDVAGDWLARLNPSETVDVWIDDSGLLRRMTANMAFGPLMTANVAIDFSDYGINPQIDVPPDAQVESAS